MPFSDGFQNIFGKYRPKSAVFAPAGMPVFRQFCTLFDVLFPGFPGRTASSRAPFPENGRETSHAASWTTVALEQKLALPAVLLPGMQHSAGQQMTAPFRPPLQTALARAPKPRGTDYPILTGRYAKGGGLDRSRAAAYVPISRLGSPPFSRDTQNRDNAQA